MRQIGDLVRSRNRTCRFEVEVADDEEAEDEEAEDEEEAEEAETLSLL